MLEDVAIDHKTVELESQTVATFKQVGGISKQN